jgi:hypothetical protein
MSGTSKSEQIASTGKRIVESIAGAPTIAAATIATAQRMEFAMRYVLLMTVPFSK